MTEREELHKLIDRLPEEELSRIRSVLEEACEPVPEGPGVLDRIDAMIEELTKDITDEEWASLPTDLSYNHDHYAYGTPKKPLPKEMRSKKKR